MVNWIKFGIVYFVVSLIVGILDLFIPTLDLMLTLLVGTILIIIPVYVAKKATGASWSGAIYFLISVFVIAFIVSLALLPITLSMIIVAGIDAVLLGMIVGYILKLPLILIASWLIFGKFKVN